MIPTLRPATLADLGLICEHRERIFLESGRDPALVDRFSRPARTWHAARLEDGRYLGWIAEVDGEAVGSVGLVFLDWSPGPSHPDTDRRGLVMNLYVEPAHRRSGLGEALMGAVETAARDRGAPFLVLHASDAGRPLYERMNWRATNEMSLSLTP